MLQISRLGPASAARIRAWLLRGGPRPVVERLREVPLILTHSVDRALAELAGLDDVIIVPGRGAVPAPPAHGYGAGGSRGASTPLVAFHGPLASTPLGDTAADDVLDGTEVPGAAEALATGAPDEDTVGDGIDDVEPEAPPVLASSSVVATAASRPAELQFVEPAPSEDARGAAAAAAPAPPAEEALVAIRPSPVALVASPLLTVGVGAAGAPCLCHSHPLPTPLCSPSSCCLPLC